MDNARLAEQLRKVLQRYHDSNITLSKKEMEVGDDVHFAGFMVGVRGCRPDPHKMVAYLLSRNPLWKATLPELQREGTIQTGGAIRDAHQGWSPRMGEGGAPPRPASKKTIAALPRPAKYHCCPAPPRPARGSGQTAGRLRGKMKTLKL